MQGWVKGRAVHRMRELLPKAHDDVFRIAPKNIVTGSGLSWEKLREPIG